MENNSSIESSSDSIDVTIFEDFYCLDITLPFVAEDPIPTCPEVISTSNQLPSPQLKPMDSPVKSAHEFLMPAEQTFSVFSSNQSHQLTKTPSINSNPLIVFSPAVVLQKTESVDLIDFNFSPGNESVESKENHIVKPSRPETPTDMDKTLVLKQISERTNQSPLYTPVTAMVSRFRNLALETPLALSIKNKAKRQLLQQTPKISKETIPINPIAGQHQTKLEKLKLVSPLLRSPKFRPVSTRFPCRSNSKATNSTMKKSPTVSQYKANPPVNQGSRIPVLKLI